jgi:hypothetical protein
VTGYVRGSRACRQMSMSTTPSWSRSRFVASEVSATSFCWSSSLSLSRIRLEQHALSVRTSSSASGRRTALTTRRPSRMPNAEARGDGGDPSISNSVESHVSGSPCYITSASCCDRSYGRRETRHGPQSALGASWTGADATSAVHASESKAGRRRASPRDGGRATRWRAPCRARSPRPVGSTRTVREVGFSAFRETCNPIHEGVIRARRPAGTA